MGRMRCVRREMPVSGLWAALVFLIALNLRPAIAAVGPLLTRIGADLNWGEGVQGILAAMPLGAFAAISPLAELSGAWTAPLLLALALAAAQCVVAVLVGRARS